MIKHGQYHISVAAGDGRLFLSQSDPPLILYKHSDGMLRNEQGDKCVLGLTGIYLNGKLSMSKILLKPGFHIAERCRKVAGASLLPCSICPRYRSQTM